MKFQFWCSKQRRHNRSQERNPSRSAVLGGQKRNFIPVLEPVTAPDTHLEGKECRIVPGNYIHMLLWFKYEGTGLTLLSKPLYLDNQELVNSHCLYKEPNLVATFYHQA